MHTIRKTNGAWLVQFVSPIGDPGYNPQRWDVASCASPHVAAQICSLLNGGAGPDVYCDADVQWIGGR